MHLCGEAMCVNPTHLKTGLQRENVHEQIARGAFQKPLGYQQAIKWMRQNKSTCLVTFIAQHFGRDEGEIRMAIG